MKKPLVICLALVAVAAIVLACVFGFQKAGLDQQVKTLTEQLEGKSGELESAKTELGNQLTEAQTALESAQAELSKLKEAAGKAQGPRNVRMPDFFSKYRAEGQRSAATISIEAGNAILQSAPEETRKMIQDLLAALKIEMTAQSLEGQQQGSLRILLSDEAALDITAASDGGAYYVASSLLGDKVVKVTTEQIKNLAAQLTGQMVAQGTITQEQADSLVDSLLGMGSGKVDKKAMLASMIGNPDLVPLLAAAKKLIPAQRLAEETLDAIPEGVTIEAKYALVLPLPKEALTETAVELGKVIWNMPITQQMAGAVKVNGTALTEENLVSLFRAFPDMLAGDTEIRIYRSEDGSDIQIVWPFTLAKDGKTIPANFGMTSVQENGELRMDWAMNLELEGEGAVRMTGDMDVISAEEGGNMKYVVVMTQDQNGTTFTPVEETITAVWTIAADNTTLEADVKATSRTTPEAEPVGIAFSLKDTARDLGDHAEGSTVFSLAEDKQGTLLTVNVQTRTDLAEAYIIREDAAQPLTMSAEERSAFLQEVSTSAMSGLAGLVMKLPESVRPLFAQLFGGGQ